MKSMQKYWDKKIIAWEQGAYEGQTKQFGLIVGLISAPLAEVSVMDEQGEVYLINYLDSFKFKDYEYCEKCVDFNYSNFCGGLNGVNENV